MDEYSFISENGTVRQIRDLVAKAKDEEQDVRITALETSALVYPSAPTSPEQVYSVIQGPGVLDRQITIITKGYYTILLRSFTNNGSNFAQLMINGASIASQYSAVNGGSVAISICLPLNAGDVLRAIVRGSGSSPSDALHIIVNKL